MKRRCTVFCALLLTSACSSSGDAGPAASGDGNPDPEGDAGVPTEESDGGLPSGDAAVQGEDASVPVDRAPDVHFDFRTGDGFAPRMEDDGAIRFGEAADGSRDGFTARLVLAGHPELGPTDRVGPGFATELDSNGSYGHGRYVMRVRFPTCAPGEETVSGLFTYRNDGEDHDQDGMVDNDEIDIEHLCSHPEILWLTSWTQYSDDTHFKKRTRAVDLRTGSVDETPDGGESVYDLAPGDSLPGVNIPNFPAPGAFYELGFEWSAARIRWFIVSEGEELTLWDLTQADVIARAPAPMLFNVWHPGVQWSTGDAADYPAEDAVLALDDFALWSSE